MSGRERSPDGSTRRSTGRSWRGRFVAFDASGTRSSRPQCSLAGAWSTVTGSSRTGSRPQTHRRFSTWRFTIASREAVSHHRRWRPSLSPPEVSVVTPETIAEDRERSEGIWSQAAALPEGQYRALWLRYAEDMSVKEIARALGKSTVCVKVLLYRARRALADQWNERVDATAANAQNREEHLNSGEAQ